MYPLAGGRTLSDPGVTTRITPAQLKQLDKWARKHKTTRAAALRQAVDKLVYTVPVRGTTADVPAAPRDLVALARKLRARTKRK